jgi:hypothetical protein
MICMKNPLTATGTCLRRFTTASHPPKFRRQQAGVRFFQVLYRENRGITAHGFTPGLRQADDLQPLAGRP